jgi:beta-N-acetylhexosaminidase
MSATSLEKKIAQMLMIGFDGFHIDKDHHIVEAIGKYNLGGVILYDLEQQDYKLKNIKSRKQVHKLVRDLKSLSEEQLLIGIDYEGGQVSRLKQEYGFPQTYSHKYFGDLDDVSLTYKQCSVMAATLSGLGINLNFAPVVDINLNSENPIIAKRERSFSYDAEVVISHARQFIKAHKEAGILSCIKHFPGHGSSASDSHLGFVDVTETWLDTELLPYKTLIGEDIIDLVMTAHVFNHRVDLDNPATLSKVFIDEILREQLGFKGVVISDDLNMGAIKDNYVFEESLRLAINAGVDILLISYNEDYKEKLFINLIKIIKSMIKEGSIPEERINESYNRVRSLKNKLRRAA